MKSTDDAPPFEVLEAILVCAASWEGDARIIGDVRAKDIIRAIMALQRSAGAGKEFTHRHKKRGTLYRVIGEAQVQTATPLLDDFCVTVYQGQDGNIWVRPTEEFEDGRFEVVSPSPIGEEKDGDLVFSLNVAAMECGRDDYALLFRQAAEALSRMEEREKELCKGLEAKDVKLKPLKWRHSNGHYPEWSAHCPAIDKTFRIDKSEALCFGEYPLRLDEYRPKSDGFASLAEAKAFAEQYRGDIIREVLDLRRARNLLAGKVEGK